jgi:PPM family protein phosphatase
VRVEELLSIGEFAARSGLSARVLRGYAAAGLLVPAAVDGRSGYRYYAPGQLRLARLIVLLRRGHHLGLAAACGLARHEGDDAMTTQTTGSATDPGTARTTNQDALMVSPPLFAVADGLGPSPGGETASGLALDRRDRWRCYLLNHRRLNPQPRPET